MYISLKNCVCNREKLATGNNWNMWWGMKQYIKTIDELMIDKVESYP